jgi:hypothetical protein
MKLKGPGPLIYRCFRSPSRLPAQQSRDPPLLTLPTKVFHKLYHPHPVKQTPNFPPHSLHLAKHHAERASAARGPRPTARRPAAALSPPDPSIPPSLHPSIPYVPYVPSSSTSFTPFMVRPLSPAIPPAHPVHVVHVVHACPPRPPRQSGQFGQLGPFRPLRPFCPFLLHALHGLLLVLFNPTYS